MPRVVRFFSVEGQRRRLEFAKMPPARAMTPEEENKFLNELQAQERAVREKAEAAEKVAREKAAREKAARSRAAAGRGRRVADDGAGQGRDPGEAAAAVPPRARTSRARHVADADGEPAPGVGHRSGGRRVGSASEDGAAPGRPTRPATAGSAPAPTASSADGGPDRWGEPGRGIVSRRGVIGAPQPREEK
jgi:hypothetical protein